MFMKVMPMEGALHLEWMNMTADCDSVNAERKTASEDYVDVFSVPGSVDNKMDASATDDMTYTYRLRCKKGDAFSLYSNELSANPTDEEGGTGTGGTGMGGTGAATAGAGGTGMGGTGVTAGAGGTGPHGGTHG
jgi:hypothetical protein